MGCVVWSMLCGLCYLTCATWHVLAHAQAILRVYTDIGCIMWGVLCGACCVGYPACLH